MSIDRIEKLIDIWDRIPNLKGNHTKISETELFNKYMQLFHIGEYFYLIFNTNTIKVEFISDNVFNFTGYQKENFTASTILDNIHPDDLPYYYHYEQSAVQFFSTLSKDLFFNYKFSYDFRIKTNNGNYKRVLQQTIPFEYLPEGGARTLVIYTDLTHLEIQGIPKLSFIGLNGAPSYYNVHLNNEFKLMNHNFSPKELEIIKLIVQGKKSVEIATYLNRSVFTIHNHRKKILQKSNCSNVQELLVKSIREGWV